MPRVAAILLATAWLAGPMVRGSDVAFVHAGEISPPPNVLIVDGGKDTRIDLLLAAPPVDGNKGRTTLYAVGGPVAAKLSEHAALLAANCDKDGRYRIPLTVAIPAARSGARFLLKIESLSPKPQLLGSVELRIPDRDFTDDIRTLLTGRTVLWVKPSPGFATLLEPLEPAEAGGNEPPEGALVFSEQPETDPDGTSAIRHIHIEIASGSAPVLTMTASKSNQRWNVVVRLPNNQSFANPAARAHLLQVIQFIDTLESPNQ